MSEHSLFCLWLERLGGFLAQRLERLWRRLIFGGLGGGLTLVVFSLLMAWGQLVWAQHQRGEALAARGLSQLLLFMPAPAKEALIETWGSNRERHRPWGHQGAVWSSPFSVQWRPNRECWG